MYDFETRLAKIIGRPTTQRPFICNGNPSACKIWIVGYNAATIGGDWWRYWSTDAGFDIDTWRQDYDSDRKRRSKGPSATRRRIDRITEQLSGVLETNIYATPSTKMANMPPSNTNAFDFLLETFSPEIIIAHGIPAAKHLTNWSAGKLITCPHLSRASYAVVDKIIAELQAS
jgi:hypothetical protein